MACIFYCLEEKLNKRMYPCPNTHTHYHPFSTHPPTHTTPPPPPPPAAWHELSESHVDFFINKEFYKLIEVLLSFLLIFSFKFLMEMKKMSPGYVV